MICERPKAPLRCPTIEESIAGTLALLPLGDAWQSNDPAAQRFHDAAFDPAVFDAAAFDSETIPGTILFRFWSAIGAARNYVESRLCDLRREFFCDTMSETREQWMTEYGLPDPCDPFPDLCAKVAAIGGARCEYFADVLARAGWSVTCEDIGSGCGSRVGCTRAGRARTGRRPANILVLKVELGASPAFKGRIRTPHRAGRFRAGKILACPPDTSPLKCIIERIAPAHVQIIYVT